MQQLWIWIALSAAFLALVQSVRITLRSAAARAKLRRRMARAAEGERDAEPLLRRAGYAVLGRQVRAHVSYRVDGSLRQAEVRADYVVRRGGRPYVAEVKTGNATSLRTSATRRQLLEYAHAFDAHGILLVDPERGRIHEIELAPRTRPSRRRDLALVLLGACGGALLAAWLWHLGS